MIDLLGNIFTEIISHIIGNSCHDPSLNEGEACTCHIQSQCPQKDRSDLRKVNTTSSVYFCNKTCIKFSCCFTKNLRSNNIKYSSCNRKNKYQHKTHFIAAHITEQFAHRTFEIFCFFRRAHASSVSAHWSTSSLFTHANSSSDS